MAYRKTKSTGADPNYSVYLGDGGGGMYVDVEKRRDGWYVVATVYVDATFDAEHVTEALPDEGPYSTRVVAARMAIFRALNWASDNDVKVTKKAQQAAFKFLMTP